VRKGGTPISSCSPNGLAAPGGGGTKAEGRAASTARTTTGAPKIWGIKFDLPPSKNSRICDLSLQITGRGPEIRTLSFVRFWTVLGGIEMPGHAI